MVGKERHQESETEKPAAGRRFGGRGSVQAMIGRKDGRCTAVHMDRRAMLTVIGAHGLVATDNAVGRSTGVGESESDRRHGYAQDRKRGQRHRCAQRDPSRHTAQHEAATHNFRVRTPSLIGAIWSLQDVPFHFLAVVIFLSRGRAHQSTHQAMARLQREDKFCALTAFRLFPRGPNALTMFKSESIYRETAHAHSYG